MAVGDEGGCGWLVLVDAASYYNRNYDEIVAACSDEEIEQYGIPEPWFPESPGEVHMEVPCGAAPLGEGKWGHLCEGHAEAMGIPDLEFERLVDREGVSFSGDYR